MAAEHLDNQQQKGGNHTMTDRPDSTGQVVGFSGTSAAQEVSSTVAPGLENSGNCHIDTSRAQDKSSYDDFQVSILNTHKIKDAQMTLPGQQDSQKLCSCSRKQINSSVATGSTGKPEPPFKFAGILAGVAAAFLFSLSIIIVKMLPGYDGFSEKAQTLFFRGLVQIILSSSHILYFGSTFLVERDEFLVNFSRAIFGTLGILGCFCSLNYISAGDSTAIIFSSPIWTSILSYFIFEESVSWILLPAVPASVVGIVLISHPTLIVAPEQMWRLDSPKGGVVDNISSIAMDEDSASQAGADFDFEHRWPGIVFALLTSIMYSLVFIVLKFRKKTGIQTNTFWLSVCTTSSGLTIICFLGEGNRPSTAFHWLVLLSNGLFAWLAQTAVQWALIYEEAGRFSVVRTLDVVFSFALSAALLEDAIYWTSILGSAIISAVVVSMMLNDWITSFACCLPTNKETPEKVSQQVPRVDTEQDNSGRVVELVRGKTSNRLTSLGTPRAVRKIQADAKNGHLMCEEC